MLCGGTAVLCFEKREGAVESSSGMIVYKVICMIFRWWPMRIAASWLDVLLGRNKTLCLESKRMGGDKNKQTKEPRGWLHEREMGSECSLLHSLNDRHWLRLVTVRVTRNPHLFLSPHLVPILPLASQIISLPGSSLSVPHNNNNNFPLFLVIVPL